MEMFRKRISILIITIVISIHAKAYDLSIILCKPTNSSVDSICDMYFSILRKDVKKSSLDEKDLLSLQEIVHFMEKLTGIKSEISKGDYNRWAFTKNDLLKWNRWYNKNRFDIAYDSISHNMFYKKKLVYNVKDQTDWEKLPGGG